MSLIAEYRQTEAAIKEMQDRLDSLKGDERLQKELKFEESLRGLLAEHGKSLRDVVAILDPNASSRPVRKEKDNSASNGQRRARKLKTYTNPHNGEVIETKGGNHKVLKEWKNQYGADEVEGWAKF